MKKIFVHNDNVQRSGQHPERMTATEWYLSEQGLCSFAVAAQPIVYNRKCIKERTERRISGESCLSEASYAAARSGVSSFN
jgi:hypothetical protein